MRLRRRPINSDVEKQVLIGLITSDKICHTLKNLIDPKLFQLEVGKKVSFWIKDYYSLYGRSPGKNIQEIYLAERSDLDPEVSQDISEFLQTLSEEYLKNPPNEDYLLNQSTSFLQKQSAAVVAKEILLLIESHKGQAPITGEIDKIISGYNKKTEESIETINPLDIKVVTESIQEDETPLLVMPEPLGSFIGNLHRGYVLGILGSPKRGKTFWAQNFTITALEAGLRVIFISLEMPYKKLVKRFWQQLGCFPQKDGQYDFPTFDCEKNKHNTCTKEIRTNHVKYGEGGYISCDLCKEKDGLKLIITKQNVFKEGITVQNSLKKVKAFSLMHGKNNVRFICYPMFSANLSQIINDIDSLEWREGFIPDVIVLDYPGILKEERITHSDHSAFGETWKTIKQIAEEKQVLFIAPFQTNRAGSKADHLSADHTAGYFQILGHMDIAITLNQNEKDYENKIMRVGKIASRWTELHPGKELTVLSQLQCGQPYFGSRITKTEIVKK